MRFAGPSESPLRLASRAKIVDVRKSAMKRLRWPAGTPERACIR